MEEATNIANRLQLYTPWLLISWFLFNPTTETIKPQILLLAHKRTLLHDNIKFFTSYNVQNLSDMHAFFLHDFLFYQLSNHFKPNINIPSRLHQGTEQIPKLKILIYISKQNSKKEKHKKWQQNIQGQPEEECEKILTPIERNIIEH